MSDTKPRRKNWSVSVGPYRNRIRVFKDPTSGIIYAEHRDPDRPGKYKSYSLCHRDEKRAHQWATETVARWMAGESELRNPSPSPKLSHILTQYLNHRTPRKVASERQADHRRAKMWIRWLTPTKDMSKLSLREWETFIDARRSGVINAEGETVSADERKPVGDGTVWGDLVFLHSVLNWAVKWRENDRYLLTENVARGFPLPREINPRRPVVSAERFAAVRAKAGEVMMRVGRGKNAREEFSYTPEILDIAWGTGRRISAILALRYTDLRLGDGPFGSICWPRDTDKMKREWSAPINEDVRAAINRVRIDRQLKGSPFLFPNPNDLTKPVSKELATSWLLRAEELAGVGHLDGGSWHPYRRGWATARKHFPDVDVALAGGWSDLTSLKTCYQQADEETLLEVVSLGAARRTATGT